MSDPRYRFYRDAEGRQRAARTNDEWVCDFCLSPDPLWDYPAAEMEVLSSICNRSDDEWGACQKCHEYLQAGDIEGLVCWSVEQQRRLSAEYDMPPRTVHLAMQRYNILRFMDARTGPPTPTK